MQSSSPDLLRPHLDIGARTVACSRRTIPPFGRRDTALVQFPHPRKIFAEADHLPAQPARNDIAVTQGDHQQSADHENAGRNDNRGSILLLHDRLGLAVDRISFDAKKNAGKNKYDPDKYSYHRQSPPPFSHLGTFDSERKRAADCAARALRIAEAKRRAGAIQDLTAILVLTICLALLGFYTGAL